MLILPLNEQHDRQGFSCGDANLNNFLVQTAGQHKKKGVSSTYVAVNDEASPAILGFYSLSLAEVVNEDLPERARKRMPHKVPIFRLGRLATALAYQGTGLRVGEFMLFDAIDRVTRIADEVGGFALVVNAKPTAATYYLQYGFEAMADHPLNFILRL
jgi:hypothetical protein